MHSFLLKYDTEHWTTLCIDFVVNYILNDKALFYTAILISTQLITLGQERSLPMYTLVFLNVLQDFVK